MPQTDYRDTGPTEIEEMNEAEQKEYDAAYAAEMEKLDAAAGANASTTDDGNGQAVEEQKTEKTEEAATDAQALETDPVEDPLKKLETRLESTEKALRDTKAWATKTATELKQLRKEREEQERAATRPQVLDDNPGLEEAIHHVVGGKAPKQAEDVAQNWADTVATALPELDALLEQNPEFSSKAAALAKQMGDDWANPIIAIRELGRLQRDIERAATSTAAQEAARRDFQQKGQKKTAMQVPTGSATRPPAAKSDGVKEIEEMSDSDFKKMRARTLGYS